MELRWLIKKDGTKVFQQKIAAVKYPHGIFGGPFEWRDIPIVEENIHTFTDVHGKDHSVESFPTPDNDEIQKAYNRGFEEGYKAGKNDG